LGWSTFAGFFVLGTDLSGLSECHVMAARDTHMGILNLLIAAVNILIQLSIYVYERFHAGKVFIKLLAWNAWCIQHTLDAMEHEMQWMVKRFAVVVHPH
jgi:hypothetical protein